MVPYRTNTANNLLAYGDCVPTAIKNIYSHYGVQKHFTAQELLDFGYKPGNGGASIDAFKKAGINIKKIDLLCHKKNF